jgi:hypothetical protein
MSEQATTLVRLNLGSGPNPLDGFVNLDKETGWLFKHGLPYPDASVEAITEAHALMYVPIGWWPHVFSECARILIPGGVLRVTQDSTADPASARFGRRRSAAVATTPELVIAHMVGADFDQVAEVAPGESLFADRSLIQHFHGDPPDVFHVEGVKR